MAYWYADSEHAERWHPLAATSLDEAIEAARHDGLHDVDRGAPFVVAEADPQTWRFDCFDRIDEEFDGINEELGDGDGDPPSIDAGISTHKAGMPKDLTDLLEATLRTWVEQNGKPTAWALSFSAYHKVPATEEWHRREQGSSS